MQETGTGIQALILRQRAFFNRGATRSLEARRNALAALDQSLRAGVSDLLDALREDLGKPPIEAYASEIGFVLAELAWLRRHLRRWMRPSRVRSPLLLLPGSSQITFEPRGVTFILSPWNYPFQLAFSPLLASVAAGNTVVLKPSEHAPRTAGVLATLVRSALPSEHVAVVPGDSRVAAECMEERFDYVFLTGGAAAGRAVAQAAARHLTPCTLELGGKSPCIVCADAELEVAARRIVWGKFLNAGQTCVAPDYVLADQRIADPLIKAMTRCIREFYGEDPRRSPDYGRVVSERHLDRLQVLLQPGRIVCGGEVDRDERYIAPTILADVPAEAPVLHEEIFGPILPVRAYDELDVALAELKARPTPLALYLFSNDRRTQDRILAAVPSGGACVNDTLLHLLNPRLPFGGLGESGFGAYHGKAGLETFSHRRSIVRRWVRGELRFRYPPARIPLAWFQHLLPWLLR